ncbi:very short patch repair endonuclease [Arthrobacter sedimenti]|uniref:Very short patch repair endonuclease n=1 Tax=Arthrobacter sedimenti TaxID=2694931 RepID=A0ABV8WFQ6_9MICC
MESSWATTPAVRKAMQGNHSRDTKPELAVRRILHAKGLRYRVSYRPIPGLKRTADVVFTRLKVAVFIDGCFWHGCPTHYRAPRSNTPYWEVKLQRNQSRDAEISQKLRLAGWTELRFWSHEDPLIVADRIHQEICQAKQRLAKEKPEVSTPRRSCKFFRLTP